jgi:hypothetical protein
MENCYQNSSWGKGLIKSRKNVIEVLFQFLSQALNKGVGMIRAEIGLKNRQIINETYSFRFFLIL